MKPFSILLLFCLVVAQLAFLSAMEIDSLEQPTLRQRRSLSLDGKSESQGSLKVNPDAHDKPERALGHHGKSKSLGSLERQASDVESSYGLDGLPSFFKDSLMLMVPAYQLWLLWTEYETPRVASLGLSVILSALYVFMKRNKHSALLTLIRQFIMALDVLHLSFVTSYMCMNNSHYWFFAFYNMIFIALFMMFDFFFFLHELKSSRVIEFYGLILCVAVIVRTLRITW